MYHTIFFFGDRRTFESLEDVASYYHYHYITGRAHNLRVYYTYSHQRVETEIVEKAFQEYRSRLHYRFRKKKDYVFRCGPVPNITGRWRRGGRRQRPPRHKFLLINKEFLRGVEIESSVYDRWESKNRGNEKNWKSQRKTQYKPVYKAFE